MTDKSKTDDWDNPLVGKWEVAPKYDDGYERYFFSIHNVGDLTIVKAPYGVEGRWVWGLWKWGEEMFGEDICPGTVPLPEVKKRAYAALKRFIHDFNEDMNKMQEPDHGT